MKTILIGQKGIGATTFIKNELIPNLKDPSDFMAFDLTRDYVDYPLPHQRIIVDGLVSGKGKEAFIKLIKSCKETTIILDCYRAFLMPQKDNSGYLSYEWLEEILEGKEVIMSINNCSDLDPRTREIKKIYLFDTMEFDDGYSKNILNSVYGKIITKVPRFVRS